MRRSADPTEGCCGRKGTRPRVVCGWTFSGEGAGWPVRSPAGGCGCQRGSRPRGGLDWTRRKGGGRTSSRHAWPVDEARVRQPGTGRPAGRRRRRGSRRGASRCRRGRKRLAHPRGSGPSRPRTVRARRGPRGASRSAPTSIGRRRSGGVRIASPRYWGKRCGVARGPGDDRGTGCRRRGPFKGPKGPDRG